LFSRRDWRFPPWRQHGQWSRKLDFTVGVYVPVLIGPAIFTNNGGNSAAMRRPPCPTMVSRLNQNILYLRAPAKLAIADLFSVSLNLLIRELFVSHRYL